MNCCSILIKIKDFLPKLSKIPYQNYICIFTHEEFEGRISLMQYEYQHINHEIKDIKSDIIYKIKLMDIITKKYIGISEHCIKYDIINNLYTGTSINIINQIRLISNQSNKINISSNSYNKLNLTISTEIIKYNKTPINYIIKDNSEFLKLNLRLRKNNFSKKNINVKSIKTEENKNKNNLSINEGIKDVSNISYKKNEGELFNEKDKNNINLNMHNITVKNYYTINSSPPLNIKSVKDNKIYIKKYLKKNNLFQKSKERKEKKEINYTKIKINKKYQSSTEKYNSLESEEINNTTNKSIKVGRKKIFRIKKHKKKYNNNSFKVINCSGMKHDISMDKIIINRNKYLNTSTKNYAINNFDPDKYNSLEISSYNMSYNSKSFSKKKKNTKKLESIISPKNLKQDIKSKPKTSRLKNNDSIENLDILKNIQIINLKAKNDKYLDKKNNRYRKQCKNNIISLLDYYILLNKKLKKYIELDKKEKSKYFLEKEFTLNLLEKKNIIKQKNNENKIKRYIHVNINSKLNNQIIYKLRKVKKKEFNIFENIFNTNINKDDLFNQEYKDKIKDQEENNKINLCLVLIKNIIKNYGNISQIYNNNVNKKSHLLNLLINNDIEINSDDEFLIKKEKNNFKEIKEELIEESIIEYDKETNEQADNIKENIIDKILISEFPLKYGKITNKKFIKVNSNEYLFNNEIKVIASYINNKILLKVENKEFTLDEFVSYYAKEKNDKNKNNIINNMQRNKKNIFWEKYSRNFRNNLLLEDNLNKNGFKKKEEQDKNI